MGRTAWIAGALLIAGCASPQTEPVLQPVPQEPDPSRPPSDIEKAFREVDQSPPGLELR